MSSGQEGKGQLETFFFYSFIYDFSRNKTLDMSVPLVALGDIAQEV